MKLLALQVASNLGLSGRLKRLEGKVEAAEVNEKEVEMEEQEKKEKQEDEVKED